MTYEPLSSQTYRDHRVLLGISTVAVLVEVFDIKIGTLPLGGLSVVAPDHLIWVTLVIAIVYLSLAFGIRAWKDFRNRPEEPYQEKLRVALNRTRDQLREEVVHNAQRQIAEQLHVAQPSITIGVIDELLRPYVADPKIENPNERSLFIGAAEEIAIAFGGHHDPVNANSIADALQEAAKAARIIGRLGPDRVTMLTEVRRRARPLKLFFAFEIAVPVVWSVFALLLLLGVVEGRAVAELLGLAEDAPLPFFKQPRA